EAKRVGLPERTAVASILRQFTDAGFGAVAVVGSAATERDRSRHQQARTIISVSAVSAMILGFGLVALRQQGQKLALEKQVELARVREERDVELAKANRMAALAALASGFAHEIGTPLGIIAGRVEQLRSPATTTTPERRGELLAQVALQVDRIGKLIRSLLSFARGDAPRLVEARAQDLAENAMRLMSHRFDAAGVELRLVRADEPTGARLMCDPALFEQVLVNILSNALEASAPGHVVTLGIEQRPADLSFVVRDEGSGVSEAALERAMEPFFTTKAGRGGSGLGLTIAREIVAHHRGELVIRKRSDAGQSGTEVVVRVPHLAEV
ncbi:MAG TPA: HAMP domain-containing sensor histidine kinase, partial [Polyangiaceae bacterium]|nr:HAMP domain-containing sensor histidine kinase [Polyangiaceae bacterium]